MRTFTLFFLPLLFLTACSKERQTLNRIEGTFETVEFVLTVSGTDTVFFTASPSLQFGECAPRDTRCTMTVVDSDSTVYNYGFEYNNDPGSGAEQISFTPLDKETWTAETTLSRALHDHFDFELNQGELRLYRENSRWTQESLRGYDYYDISITAIKR